MPGSKQQQELGLIRGLQHILDSSTLELTPVDEVWPNLYIGNLWVSCVIRAYCRQLSVSNRREKLTSFISLFHRTAIIPWYCFLFVACVLIRVMCFPRAVAQNRKTLHNLGITHVLNAAHSKQGSIGDQRFYGNACIYLGIPAEDSDSFDLSQYFKPAADFIHKALKNKDGTVDQRKTCWPSKNVLFGTGDLFFIPLHRESAGALHHGNKSIGHFGPGLSDAAAASHSERCPEAHWTKTTYISQQTFPVSPPQAGRSADI